MVQWRVYYHDGTTIDNTDYAPADIPIGKRWGVIAIVQHDSKHNRNVPSGRDFYIHLKAGEWLKIDETGRLQYDILWPEKWDVMLAGFYTYSPDYDAIMNRVMLDTDFLPQSAGLGRFGE